MKSLSMRDIFGQKLAELGMEDSRIVALDGDLGNSTRLSVVEEKLPQSFLQMGIAEQNMVGVAAGLATVGIQPWVCSFATFLTKRAYDQIVVSIDQPSMNVKLIGAYSGLLTSNTGKTHHALDDVALMTSLPNMTVIAPGDAMEVEKAMEALKAYDGPAYLRLSREEAIPTFTEDTPFEIGKAQLLREGKDVALISTGSMTHRVIEAAALLERDGVSVHVLHMPTLKPIDTEAILYAASNVKLIVTAEEHYIRGGLGSLISEVISEHCPMHVFRIGVNNQYSECGSNEDLLRKHGFTPEQLAARIHEAISSIDSLPGKGDNRQ